MNYPVEFETIKRLEKELGFASFKNGVSRYGTVNDINIRLSDHLPKVHNLIDSKITLDEDENGVINYVFIVLSDDCEIKASDCDAMYEWEEEIKEHLEHVTDKEVNVSLNIFNAEEDYNVVKTIADREISLINQ